MDNPLANRDLQQRVMVAAHHFQETVAAVEKYLETAELGPVPAWVFAIDRLPVEKVFEISAELAELEVHRRSARQALHSLMELVALGIDGSNHEVGADGKVDVASMLSAAATGEGNDWKAGLDRFITIVERARLGGCIYLNGTFAPVSAREGAGDAEDVR